MASRPRRNRIWRRSLPETSETRARHDLPGVDGTPPPYRAAAIQFEPTLFGKTANLEALLRLTRRPRCEADRHPGDGDDRLLLGHARRDCQRRRARARTDHPTLRRDRRRSRLLDRGRSGRGRSGNIYYNSAVLIGPEGPVGLYRKTHAYISEPKWAKDGDLGLPVFETPIGRIAMTICMDACYPRRRASRRWRVRTSSASRPTGSRRRARRRAGWRAPPRTASTSSPPTGTGWNEGCSSPRVGGDRSGRVLAERPRYRRRHRLGMDRSGSRPEQAPDPGRPEDLIADRRPDAYGAMTLNAYLWDPQEFHGLYGIRPLPESALAGGRRPVLPARGDVAGNLDRLAGEAAALTETDLIVFPELVLTGAVADRRRPNGWPRPSPVRARSGCATSPPWRMPIWSRG